jgi:sporulation protein YlmC with PRC-barrel domain
MTDRDLPSGLFDLRLRLLDRQVVDPDGRPVCKVDDVEFARGETGAWEVSALLSGPLALGPRLPGLFGRWVVAVGRRLSRQPAPRPRRIPFERVTGIAASVTVDRRRDELGIAALEDWVREHVIDPIPGSRHASQ